MPEELQTTASNNFSTEYSSYRNFVLEDRDSMLKFSDLLGKFHSASEGFIQPPGIRAKVRWGKLSDKYKKMTLMIKNYNNELTNSSGNNEFDALFLEKSDRIIHLADKVIGVINSDDYLRALSSSMQRRELCINRISDTSAVTIENKLFLIGLNDIGYNMAIEDLVKLINRIPKKYDKGILQKEIISVYYDVREIDIHSLKVLNALSSFPYEIFKIIIRYLKHAEDEPACLKKLKQSYMFNNL